MAGEELLEKEYMIVSAPTKCSNWSLDHKSLITNFGFAYNWKLREINSWWQKICKKSNQYRYRLEVSVYWIWVHTCGVALCSVELRDCWLMEFDEVNCWSAVILVILVNIMQTLQNDKDCTGINICTWWIYSKIQPKVWMVFSCK